MRKYIVILFVFVFQIGIAQEGFIKAYNFGYNTAVQFNAMVLDEDKLVVCGYLIDSMPPYQGGVFCALIDTFGQTLNFNAYYDPDGYSYVRGEEPGGMIKLEDNSGYLFTGNIFQGSGGFLMKFDNEGVMVWTKVLEEPIALQGYYKRILEVEDGFLIMGVKQKVDFNADIFLMKLDESGNKLWEKSYGLSSRRDEAANLFALNNNEYIIGGYIGPNQGVSWQQWHHQIQIFAVDSLGEEKWYWESDPPNDTNSVEDSQMKGLHRDADGNWIYTEVRMEYQTSFGGWYEQGKFVVRDSSFNIITERVYDEVDGQKNRFMSLIQLADGDWLGVGVNREIIPQPSTISGHLYASMNRISNGEDGQTSLGDSLWTRKDLTFPDSMYGSRQFLLSAVELPSGSIIAAGYFDAFYAGDTDHGLLIKVNQHGCIDNVDCVPTNFPNIMISAKEVADTDLKIYPNPVRHILHYESDQVPVWDKVELLAMTGQVINTVCNNKSITMSDLPSGIYVLRFWKDGSFWTQKVIRQ